jgi:hypothetical protein
MVYKVSWQFLITPNNFQWIVPKAWFEEPEDGDHRLKNADGIDIWDHGTVLQNNTPKDDGDTKEKDQYHTHKNVVKAVVPARLKVKWPL